MNFSTATLNAQQKYRLLSGGITPRPIAWISTRSKQGIDNLAPYSFFTVASCDPPVLLFTQITTRNQVDKDSLQNLKETGECVVNIVNSDLLEMMNKTSASLARDESEFNFADVASCTSLCVTPLSVKESPVRYECSLRALSLISDLPTGGTLVLLDVKSVYVQDALYENGVLNQTALDTVGKMGGDTYALTQTLVELKRP